MIMEGRLTFGFLLTIVVTFAIAPLIAILGYTFLKDGQFDISQINRMLEAERVWRTLGNSMLLGVLVIVGTTIIAFQWHLSERKQVYIVMIGLILF